MLLTIWREKMSSTFLVALGVEAGHELLKRLGLAWEIATILDRLLESSPALVLALFGAPSSPIGTSGLTYSAAPPFARVHLV
jgi:hypothetical protein